jgi:phosphoglycolate phosphatase
MADLLHPRITAVNAALIIFDKDGTLIDFHAMWGGWAAGLAQRLEDVTGKALARPLFELMEYDPVHGRINPHGRLAIAPMAVLWRETADLLQQLGLTQDATQSALTAAWQPPDPVQLAVPLADLPRLFARLSRQGLQIAVATSDDREPTETMVAALGLTAWVSAIAAADDDLVSKPAPDMVRHVCRRLNIPPARAVMVGDTAADMQMGRAAGVGLTVGVLSGVSSADILAPHADLVLPSVADLLRN